MKEQLNVLGLPLKICGQDPMTGFFRDGFCRCREDDLGAHIVCAIMTDDFLKFSRDNGNDLITPLPEYQFPGLKEGDQWCLCASRWVEALAKNKAPNLILEATHEKILEYVSLETLFMYRA